ncbi:hypothetical protein [Bacillus horti]|uniref:Uncharacterized BrkB/YihY/UPF0761 family membrane protein n=1 Tax=Caldalkalibacillus horti TaxID=77523 RepID=A0ABT9W3R6_9BACI|nr:hypothetical protein [Bacillus horti]MDQ0167717.1 uncharacterized BrkB/YihY/UPF0761 family membrane protein [Bacillus horti]
MAVLVALLDVLRWLAAVLSLVLGFRKLYRWLKRKFRRNKQKPTS